MFDIAVHLESFQRNVTFKYTQKDLVKALTLFAG